MSRDINIPRPTVKRLSLYLRELEGQALEGRATISSRELGDLFDLTDAQVRKDLAHFGQLGHPGIGYRVASLTEALRRVLRTDHTWQVAVVGAGKIGRAVIGDGRLATKGFQIQAVFDDDPELIGTTINGHVVRNVTGLASAIRNESLELALLAVPASAAQEVTDALVAAGIHGILNFAPVRLALGADVPIVSVDLTVSLEQLAYKVSTHEVLSDGAGATEIE